jgi:hypothetical protein
MLYFRSFKDVQQDIILLCKCLYYFVSIYLIFFNFGGSSIPTWILFYHSKDMKPVYCLLTSCLRYAGFITSDSFPKLHFYLVPPIVFSLRPMHLKSIWLPVKFTGKNWIQVYEEFPLVILNQKLKSGYLIGYSTINVKHSSCHSKIKL